MAIPKTTADLAVESPVRSNTFTIQWHITERCNWRCKHCYQEGSCRPVDLSLDQLFHILDNCLSINISKDKKVNFTITGGEPMIRDDFFEFAERLSHDLDDCGYEWRMLSNGSLITEESARKLKDLNLQSFQISMEGMERTNDSLRGKGAFKKISEAIRILVRSKIRVSVSLTLTEKNIKDVFPLARYLKDLGVTAFAVRRLVPTGEGVGLRESMILSGELRDLYFKIMEFNKKESSGSFSLLTGCESAIFNEDLLSNGSSSDHPRLSMCGVSLGGGLNIMSNGDLVPCRRMPIKVGNALKDSFYDAYYSDTMVDLRDHDKSDSSCRKCSGFNFCLGGAKCIAYALTGKWDVPDPQCWKTGTAK